MLPRLISYSLLLFPLALSAQSSLTLNGLVRDAAGAPIPAAVLSLQPSGLSATTNGEGQFSFASLTPGDYLLTVTATGFVPHQETLALASSLPNLALRLHTMRTSVEISERMDDFLAAHSVSVTKSPQQLLDLPYAVQVLPKALLEDRQVQELRDLYRNISGVTDSPYSAMTFRGFTQREILFNGVRGNPYGSLDSGIDDAGFSTSQGRLTNIEFVEVLKGPAAVLFGAGEPGGVISFVTRKPRANHAAELSFRTGSFSQKGGHGELTGPISRKHNLFYRAAWYQEDRRTFRYNSRNENSHAAAALSWRPGPATSLGFEYEYIDQLLPAYRLRGIPVNSGGAWLAAREWNSSEPGDFSALQSRIFQTRLDHAFTPTLRLDATFRFLNFDRPERYHEPRGINPDGRTMRREFRDQYRANDDFSLTLNTYQRLAPRGFFTHNLVYGFETVRQDWTGRYATARERSRGGPVPDLDMRTPLYTVFGPAPYALPAYTNQNVDSRRLGFFLQDQVELLPRLQL
ncbi:MAG: TonB-dependent receptor, partial [Acidobacteria bacterium]|nr:TonB-dependent receptor [Acidobacteriota bacterium]